VGRGRTKPGSLTADEAESVFLLRWLCGMSIADRRHTPDGELRVLEEQSRHWARALCGAAPVESKRRVGSLDDQVPLITRDASS